MACGKKRHPSADISFSKKPKAGSPDTITKKKKKKSPHSSEKSSVFSKLIETGVCHENEAVFYMRRKDRSVMKQGMITHAGVFCICCGDIFTLSNFEKHAGSSLHRPSANMYLADGRTVAECLLEAGNMTGLNSVPRQPRMDTGFVSASLSDAMDCDSPESGIIDPLENTDNYCQVCGYGGELMICDTCPSAFHANCVNLRNVPDGNWWCFRCRCGICGMGAGHSGKSVTTNMLRCMQCDVHYHGNCVDVDQEDEYEGEWLCGTSCRAIFTYLRLLVGRVNYLDNGLTWILLRSFKEDKHCGLTPCKKGLYADYDRRISSPLQVLQLSFDPIVDPESKIDLLVQMAYNRRSDRSRLDCSGFYLMVLMKGDEAACVASIRVHDASVAEMPFVATAPKFRKQGMCRMLVDLLEAQLRRIGVARLVLPSLQELLQTWTGSFGFTCVDKAEELIFRFGVMAFPGTTLLEKKLIAAGMGTSSVRAPSVIEKCEDEGFKKAHQFQGVSVRKARSHHARQRVAFRSMDPPVSCH